MLFSNTLDNLNVDICFGDAVLESVSHIKLLGITVDNKLSWKFHIIMSVRKFHVI